MPISAMCSSAHELPVPAHDPLQQHQVPCAQVYSKVEGEQEGAEPARRAAASPQPRARPPRTRPPPARACPARAASMCRPHACAALTRAPPPHASRPGPPSRAITPHATLACPRRTRPRPARAHLARGAALTPRARPNATPPAPPRHTHLAHPGAGATALPQGAHEF